MVVAGVPDSSSCWSLSPRVILPGAALVLAVLAMTGTGCGSSSGGPGSTADSGARLDAKSTRVTDTGASGHRADARHDVGATDAGVPVHDAGRADADARSTPADASHDSPTPPADAARDAPADAGATDACPDAAGSLILYAIPPPATLDWTSPNSMLNTALESAAAGEVLIASGQAVLSHEIGHINLEARLRRDQHSSDRPDRRRRRVAVRGGRHRHHVPRLPGLAERVERPASARTPTSSPTSRRGRPPATSRRSSSS